MYGYLPTGTVSPIEFTVGMTMCWYMGDKDVCWPSREEISQRTGIRRIATISAAITKLVDIGFIVRERTQRGFRYRLCNTTPGVAPTATPDVSGDAPSATPEQGEKESWSSATRTSGVAPSATPITLHENKKETSFGSSQEDDSSKPNCSSDSSPAQTEEGGRETLPPSSTPPALALVPPQGKKKRGESVPPPTGAKGKKYIAKKQYPGNLDVDAEKLVALYAELVKPKDQDDSGSRKTFTATAKRLLSEGRPFSDLERSIRSYAASRKQREKRPEEAQYRWGFQTFFGPKNEHWRDFLAIEATEASRPVRSEGTGEAARRRGWCKPYERKVAQ